MPELTWETVEGWPHAVWTSPAGDKSNVGESWSGLYFRDGVNGEVCFSRDELRDLLPLLERYVRTGTIAEKGGAK